MFGFLSNASKIILKRNDNNQSAFCSLKLVELQWHLFEEGEEKEKESEEEKEKKRIAIIFITRHVSSSNCH